MTEAGSHDKLAELAGQFGDLVHAMSDERPGGIDPGIVTRFAVRAVPGTEHASISLMRGDQSPVTLAATAELPLIVDELQYELGEGPCLQALTQNDIVWSSDLAQDRQWPRFAPKAVETTGVRSMLSYRLFLTESTRASLNFYATEPHVLRDESVSIGAIFAAYASLTVVNALNSDKVMHLERALESNREIGVAIGILMARELCTQQQAFERLRTASQTTNRKLRDIAEDVKQIGELPTF